MKKFLKTLGMTLGLVLFINIIMSFSLLIASIIIRNPEMLSKNIYTIAFISNVISIILIHLMYLVYDKKLLTKELFRKIQLDDLVNISVFSVGFVALSMVLIQIITQLIPGYESVQNQIQANVGSLWQLTVLVILIPICEEIIFRKVIFGYLKENYNIVFAVILQALTFAIAHFNLVQGIYTFMLGIALALVYMYSKTLLGSIVMHIIFNLFGVFIIPQLISFNSMLIYPIILVGVLCFIFSILRMRKKSKKALCQ